MVEKCLHIAARRKASLETSGRESFLVSAQVTAQRVEARRVSGQHKILFFRRSQLSRKTAVLDTAFGWFLHGGAPLLQCLLRVTASPRAAQPQHRSGRMQSFVSPASLHRTRADR